MALRKGLGGCWAEGDSLSGMAVHYTMVTRSGWGHGDHCCSPVVTGGWWLGVQWWRGAGAGESCLYLAAGRSLRVPVLLPVSPSHPVHVTPLSCHQAGSLPRYTACTISVPLSWLSLCLYPAAVQCLDAARRAVSR